MSSSRATFRITLDARRALCSSIQSVTTELFGCYSLPTVFFRVNCETLCIFGDFFIEYFRRLLCGSELLINLEQIEGLDLRTQLKFIIYKVDRWELV